jgi:hypothetical protein
MKNALLFLAAALLLFSGTIPGLAAQDAATPADPPEATAAWNAWKAEADPAKKLQLGIAVIKQFPGTLSADNVAGTSFNEKLTNDQKAQIADAYYTSYTAAGKTGRYLEYSLYFVVTSEKDPVKRFDYSKAFLEKFSSSQYAADVRKRIVGTRYAVAKSHLDANRINEAITIANQSFAEGDSDPWQYFYLTGLTGYAATEFGSKGTNSPLVGQVGPWADRAIAYLSAGKAPETVKDKPDAKAEFDRNRPAVICFMQQIKGWDQLLVAVKKASAATPEDYEKAVVTLNEAAKCADATNYLPSFLAGQALYNEYALLFAKYDALPDKNTPEAVELLNKVNDAVDGVLKAYVKVLGITAKDTKLAPVATQIEPTVAELWKYRYPDSPEGWRDAVRTGTIPPVPAATPAATPAASTNGTASTKPVATAKKAGQ